MPARSILAAVDFSEPSRKALDFGARLANHCGAALHVLHVQDSLLAAAAQSEGIDLVRESRDELARFTQTGVTVDRSRLNLHVVTGRSTLAICDLAVREGVDVIVLGMHGMSGATRVLFGSTTQGVLQQSTVPVLVVPDAWAAPQPGTSDLSGVGPVLVAVECTGAGMAAAAAACSARQDAGHLGQCRPCRGAAERAGTLERACATRRWTWPCRATERKSRRRLPG